MIFKSIQGRRLPFAVDGWKEEKRYRCVKLHLFSSLGIILSEIPVTAQKDVPQRDVNVYKMELSAVLIATKASHAIKAEGRQRYGNKWYVYYMAYI